MAEVESQDGYMVHWEFDPETSGGWAIAAIVENDRGEFAVYSDGGCSCDFPYGDNWYTGLGWTKDLNAIEYRAAYEIGNGNILKTRAEHLATLHGVIVRLRKAQRG